MDTLTILDELTGISGQDDQCGDASGLGVWYAYFDLATDEDVTEAIAYARDDAATVPVVLPAGVYILGVDNQGFKDYQFFAPDRHAEGWTEWQRLVAETATEDDAAE